MHRLQRVYVDTQTYLYVYIHTTHTHTQAVNLSRKHKMSPVRALTFEECSRSAMWHATASTRARRCFCATILAVSCVPGSRWITVDGFQFVRNALRKARCVGGALGLPQLCIHAHDRCKLARSMQRRNKCDSDRKNTVDIALIQFYKCTRTEKQVRAWMDGHNM
jgi:hypothetical protein